MSSQNITSYRKRVKERSVEDAVKNVQQWRDIIKNGIADKRGRMIHLTLTEAAKIVGIPKKTLEYYEQVFLKVNSISKIELFFDKKMGFLNQYIRQNQSKISRVNAEEKERAIARKHLIKNQILNYISERKTQTPQ